ncbi:hypothetical protein, partial [Streptococcus pneumoniae]|uniref:hypothetical protein n=1 Tax=Streptococcus pneumoniae TaxID=1313 RepID=UPI0018B07904
EQGRKRAGIFYKAAFYDRRADMSMQRRYSVECWRDGGSDKVRRVDVTDCGNVIKDFGEVKSDDWDGMDAMSNAAKAWLTEQHP